MVRAPFFLAVAAAAIGCGSPPVRVPALPSTPFPNVAGNYTEVAASEPASASSCGTIPIIGGQHAVVVTQSGQGSALTATVVVGGGVGQNLILSGTLHEDLSATFTPAQNSDTWGQPVSSTLTGQFSLQSDGGVSFRGTYTNMNEDGCQTYGPTVWTQ